MTRVATAGNEAELLSMARCATVVSIQLRLLPEEAARVMKALAVMGDGNRADGAVAMAEAALGGQVAAADGEARSVRPPVEVVVHVEASDLEGRTELGDGISAEVSRRLLCDAGVVPMLEDERGKTIDVGRKTRTIPEALRRALERVGEALVFRDPRGKEVPAQGARDGERVDHDLCVAALA